MKHGKNPIVHKHEFPRRQSNSHVYYRRIQTTPATSVRVYNLDAIYGPLHTVRIVSIYDLRKKMGPVILVKTVTYFTQNLTLYNGLSRIHKTFSAPLSLGFYLLLDKIKLRR